MHKDFEKWSIEKQKINNTDKEIPFFTEAEVWWCSLGVNIGNEQDGKNEHFERPVLVFKKFSKHTFWALPLSSKITQGEYYVTVTCREVKNSVILSQLRLVSSKRLLRKIGTLSVEELKKIEDGLMWLCIKRNPPKVGGNLGGRSPL